MAWNELFFQTPIHRYAHQFNARKLANYYRVFRIQPEC